MKHKTTLQEILLLTGTNFSSTQNCLKNENDKQDQLSENEKLQEACWNGLIYEMLPELFPESNNGKNLYLWKIVEGSSFLELELSEYPEKKDPYFSIEPYEFLMQHHNN